MATNNPNNSNIPKAFEWTDELLKLAFGQWKFIENKHGVILYEVGTDIHIVDDSQNLYYWEVSTKTKYGYHDYKLTSWCIKIYELSFDHLSHQREFTPWKWAKLQKIEDHFQKKQNEVAKDQEQVRIRASIGNIIGSGIVIPANADTIQVQWDEMQYIQQIYDMEVDISWTKTTIRTLLQNIDQSPDNAIALRNTIAFLKKTDPFSHFPGIFEYFEVIIQDKLNHVELDRGYARIEEIADLIQDDVLSISTLVVLAQELDKWIIERAQNPLPTGDRERRAAKMLEDIKIRIDLRRESEKDRILADIAIYETDITAAIDEILYLEHIPMIYNLDAYKQVNNLISLLPDELVRERRSALARLINERRNILEKDKEAKQEHQARVRMELIRDIRTNMTEISDLVDTLQNEGDILAMKRENGLVKTTQDLIWKLIPEESEKIYNELMNIFDERIASINLTESIFRRSGGKIDLGNDVRASVFEPEKTTRVEWHLAPKKSWDEIVISFKNNVGGTIEPSIQKQYRKHNPLAVSKQEFIELQEYLTRWNTRYRREFFDALTNYKQIEVQSQIDGDDQESWKKLETARDKYLSLREKSYLARMFHHLPRHNLSSRPLVPHLSSGTVIGPTTEIFLQTFADLAEKQVESQGKWSGIIIIEGDAGTGKNFKVDIYAHMTNREVFEMQGNKTAQKEDILYSYELGPDGTYRLPSYLIRGIQTPGALVLLDEINTYPPEVLKLLNPLLDGRRYINDPQFGRISVHPSVLLVWLMNPQHYLGTTPLSPEIKSRARMMCDEYPEFQLAGGTISWEEGYLVTRHMTRNLQIGKMDQNTFIEFWNACVNNFDTGVQANKDTKKVFQDISAYIAFARSMRSIYQTTMMGKGKEEFHYPISLRDGIQIIEEYERNGCDMKQAIRDVIIPKISGKNVDVGAETAVIESRIAKVL